MADRPVALPSARGGTVYTASAWVRTTQPGLEVAIHLQELRGNAPVRSATMSLVLPDTGWHQVQVSNRAGQSGDAIALSIRGGGRRNDGPPEALPERVEPREHPHLPERGEVVQQDAGRPGDRGALDPHLRDEQQVERDVEAHRPDRVGQVPGAAAAHQQDDVH